MYTHQRENAYKVPAWLDELLPDVGTPALFGIENGEYFLSQSNVIPNTAYSTMSTTNLGEDLAGAYNKARKITPDFVFSEEVLEQNETLGNSVLVPAEDGMLQWCGSFTDRDRLGLIEYVWHNFQKLDLQWRRKPNFLNSYNWLNGHPAFWVRASNHFDKTINPWEWKTNGFLRDGKAVHLDVMEHDGDAVFAFEAGAHVPDGREWIAEDNTHIIITGVYQTHYRDLRMDVYADSYEDGIIKLAVLVDKFFNIDGSEKENVEYEKSQEELKLEQIIEERASKYAPEKEKELPTRAFIQWESFDGQ